MSVQINPEVVERLAAAVPRYTSYPTAAQFNGSVGPGDYAQHLSGLKADAKLSLYAHIPFCAQLCWYCGCSTKIVNKAEPVTRYQEWLHREIERVAALLGPGRPVTHIHWGGGSPNILNPDQIRALAQALKQPFSVQPQAEFAVEIDPRGLTLAHIAAFAEAGVNRVSIGVQDFDPAVQEAINRVQSLKDTKWAIDAIRAAGITGINIDLVYGLPHQTEESVAQTIRDVLDLAPDRVALFGYAHMPARAKHQALIDEQTLPSNMERYAQSQTARRILLEAGYAAVGLDHFARPDDALATQQIARNFQGYTTDAADALIGFGASSISRLPAGYFQNAVSRLDYEHKIAAGELATVRGVLLSEDDRMRAFVIERLMCDFQFSRSALQAEFGAAGASALVSQADTLVKSDREGLLEATSDGFRLTARGKPFVRSIAAQFDAYYEASAGKYSVGV